MTSASGITAPSRFVLGGPIEEFDNSGNRAEGIMEGPETTPGTGIPGNTILTLPTVGANGSGQKAGLLVLVVVGANGCNGSAGSFNCFEPFVTNTAGTAHTA